MRRVRLRSLALLIALALLSCFPRADPDLNDDGIVDILDVSLASSCLGEPATNLQCAAADTDASGVVDSADLDWVVSNFGATGFPVVDRTAPSVEILAPANLAFGNATSVVVSGTVDDVSASVVVNGVPAPLGAGSPPAFAVAIDLVEGTNLVTVTATDPEGNVGTASLTLFVDTQPPRVTIDTPSDGAKTTAANVHVAGLINDIVAGTVNAGEAQVTVNGLAAQVANRSFLVEDVPLALGENVIEAIGVDQAGNQASASLVVVREAVMNAPEISVLSGNGQSGPIGATLSEAVTVEVRDASGVPVSGEMVVFRVVEGNGSVSDGTRDGRAVVVPSDALGRASAVWTLGSRSGVGNQRLRASCAGFLGSAEVVASALAAAPAAIVEDAGQMQTGSPGQALPRPFAAAVIDAGGNRLPGIPVTFEVLRGGGTLDGATTQVVPTDSNGVAAVVLALGAGEGADNHWVRADFAASAGRPVIFTASARVPGAPEDTSVSGVVLDNSDLPVPNATISIEGTSLVTQSDADGQFLLTGAPVGSVHLVVEGGTTTRAGEWPTLAYDLTTVAGRDNTIGMPVYLLPLSSDEICVDGQTGGTLTLPDVPGFALTVAPGSATFLDGSDTGCVSVTIVHPDKVPMPPNFGQQPRFVITIQPSGVVFDPPAPLVLPNSDGMAPGQVTEMYSFDHDLGQFVSIGTGTVTDDGLVVASDPGVGVLKAGWHCGGDPASLGTCEHECDDGNDCTNDSYDEDEDACDHLAFEAEETMLTADFLRGEDGEVTSTLQVGDASFLEVGDTLAIPLDVQDGVVLGEWEARIVSVDAATGEVVVQGSHPRDGAPPALRLCLSSGVPCFDNNDCAAGDSCVPVGPLAPSGASVATRRRCRSAPPLTIGDTFGVPFRIDESCRGVCDAGSCVDGPFGTASVQSAVVGALSRIFEATEACPGLTPEGDALFAAMQGQLLEEGAGLACTPGNEIFDEEIDSCAYSVPAVGGVFLNARSIPDFPGEPTQIHDGQRKTDRPWCRGAILPNQTIVTDGLEQIFFHELVHVAAQADGVPDGVDDEFLPRDCEAACFGIPPTIIGGVERYIASECR